MPPPKKAAKKTAAKHASPEEHYAKDLRRAYEHLGRVDALHSALKPGTEKKVATLTALAEQELAGLNSKGAADLLRAAEHLCFSELTRGQHHEPLDPKLTEAISEEFEHKLDKAHEHWDKLEQPQASLAELYNEACEQAQAAFDQGGFRRALELARGAEALAHVKLTAAHQLTGSPHLRRLRN